MEIPSTFIVRRPETAKASEELDFSKYWQAVQRRFIPAAAVGTLVLALSAAAIALQKPSYEASGKLLIRPDKTPTLTGLSPDAAREFEPITIQSNPLKTEIEVLQSQPLLKKVIERLKLTDNKGQAPTTVEVGDNLDVDVSGGTDVLEIAYSSDDPKLAAAMVNTVMRLYIENNVQLNQEEAAAAREFITAELPSAESDVRRAELALSQFQQANELVVIEDEAKAAVGFVTSLDEQISVVQSELANTNARLGGLQNQLNLSAAQALDLSAISQSQGVQEALAELQTLETQLAEARSFFKGNSPQVIELSNKVSSLRSLLRTRVKQVVGEEGSRAARSLQIGELEQSLINDFIELDVQRQGQSNQISALERARGSYAQRMNDLPELARQQKLLERKLEAVQITYETLLTNLQSLKTTGNQALGNARIIEPAEAPAKPTINKKSVAIGLGGFLASLGAFAATVLLLESRDRTVKTIDELNRLYHCDLLEAIPKGTASSKQALATDGIVVRDFPRSLASEVYRSLQVKLQYFNEVRAFKAVTIVSATPEEGTSTVAANLAMATAELKQKILLIDANLRSPKQSDLWGLPHTGNGLSHVLQGEKPLQDALQQVNSHLWVLPAGQEPPSPLALLRSPKMQVLLRAAAQSFDAIIIDSPSLLSAPDALVLGKLSDGIVVVSKLGKVNRANITAASEALRKSRQSVLGLVATNTTAKDQPGDRWLYESVAESAAHSAPPPAGQSPKTPVNTGKGSYVPTPPTTKNTITLSSDFTSTDFAAQEGSRSTPVIQLDANNTNNDEFSPTTFSNQSEGNKSEGSKSELLHFPLVNSGINGNGRNDVNGNSYNGNGNSNGHNGNSPENDH
ncbi:MAG: polysaccharide biosynthesis tyrosine autokinase [Cyanobacteria bacterium P01_F01_bin.53]